MRVGGQLQKKKKKIQGLSETSCEFHPFRSRLHCGLEIHSETFEETSKAQPDFCTIKNSCCSTLIALTWYHSRGPLFFFILSIGSITFLSLSEAVRKLGITPLFLPLLTHSPFTLSLSLSHWLWESQRGRSGCWSLVWKMVPPLLSGTDCRLSSCCCDKDTYCTSWFPETLKPPDFSSCTCSSFHSCHNITSVLRWRHLQRPKGVYLMQASGSLTNRWAASCTRWIDNGHAHINSLD